ncbi:MAG: phosphoribosyltransferase family protein [Candidatus Woesebacteria bacterium]
MSAELQNTEKCGVIATIGHDISPEYFIAGWRRLKNRGADAWGLITVLKARMKVEYATKCEGVENAKINSSVRLGHNRYATSGGGSFQNAQPFLVQSGTFTLGLAHNGNIPAQIITHLRTLLLEPVPVDASDSYIMAKFLLESRALYKTWNDTFIAVLPLFRGAFSLACVTDEDVLYAIRDKWGIRPLCVGKKADTWIVASESIAIDAMGATYQREVKPGEIIRLKAGAQSSSSMYAKSKGEHFCTLESIYFANNKSIRKGRTIESARRALGRAVARRFLSKRIAIDLVVPVLNSGKQMSMGVSEVLQMDNIEAIRLSTQERSFIQNTPEARKRLVYAKHVVDGAIIDGKRLLLCDDSLVRGTSLGSLLEKIKEHGPREIHIVLSSEPVIDICDLGIDLPTREELLAYQVNQDRPDFADEPAYFSWLKEIENLVAKRLGVDSITYLDRMSVNLALHRQENQMCRHCFGGTYPIKDYQGLTRTLPSARLHSL